MSFCSIFRSPSFYDQEAMALNGSCRIHGPSGHAHGHAHAQTGASASAHHQQQQQFTPSSKRKKREAGGMFFDPCGEGQGQGHTLCPEVSKALSGVMLIAEQKKRLEESTKVRQN